MFRAPIHSPDNAFSRKDGYQGIREYPEGASGEATGQLAVVHQFEILITSNI